MRRRSWCRCRGVWNQGSWSRWRQRRSARAAPRGAPQGSGALGIGAAGGTQEAIGADLGEAAWEDVLEESREEHGHREGEPPGLVGASVGVVEDGPPVLEAFEPVGGERDTIDVAREIARGVFAAADRLDMDRPGPLPAWGSTSRSTPARTSAARIFARKIWLSASPGMRNRGCAGVTQAAPSGVSPPAVTRRWAWGWYSRVRDQVWRTAGIPSVPPTHWRSSASVWTDAAASRRSAA